MKQIRKIPTNQCPDYQASILPAKIGETRPNSGNEEHFVSPKCRTIAYKNSFIPSAIRKWNKLPRNTRNIDYIMEKQRSKSNPLYYEGS